MMMLNCTINFKENLRLKEISSSDSSSSYTSTAETKVAFCKEL